MAHMISDKNGRCFTIGDYIDRGTFSKVYALKCGFTKHRFAGKFISKAKLQRYGISSKVYDEIKIHQGLKHAHIVQFVTYIEQESHIIIVLEYCSRYSMVNVLHALKTLHLREAKYFMLQLVSAVEYLHARHIVHRDLKLGNMFVNRHLQLKLGDFGLAVVIEYEGQRRFSRCGTPNYIAPEVINGTGHSYEVDIWALGCILFTMLEGTPPFQGQNTASTYNNILRCDFRISSSISEDAQSFITSSIQTEPKFRPTVFDLMKMNFLMSREPYPEPPLLNICEEITSSVRDKTRISQSRKSNGVRSREPIICLNPYKSFENLSKCLENICDWTQSDLGEFLSETVLVKPVVWVNSWMDYTNSYGFSYQLSNNNVGLIFNDQSRILFQNETQTVHYVHNDGAGAVYETDNIPIVLKKKVKVLLSCRKFMSESLVKAHEEGKTKLDSDRAAALTTEVFHWLRSENEIVMFLTNGSVQVNFFSDHVKFILWGLTNTVTVIERADCMRTLKIDNLKTFGCRGYLKQKLSTILMYVDNLLTDRYK